MGANNVTIPTTNTDSAAGGDLPPRPRHRGVDLLLATNELQAIVHRLIDPAPSYINNTYLEIPGLYGQLWAAMDSCRNNAASSAARSRPPMWIEAADVKRSLDTFIDSLRIGVSGHTTTQLSMIASHPWTVEDIRTVQFITRKLTRYSDDIERLVNLDHVKEITVPCPACGALYVERRDGGGALVYSYALQASAEYGCTCQACEYHWAPNQFMELATDAGIPLPTGVTG